MTIHDRYKTQHFNIVFSDGYEFTLAYFVRHPRQVLRAIWRIQRFRLADYLYGHHNRLYWRWFPNYNPRTWY